MDGTTLLGTLTTMPTILSTVLPTLPPVVLPDLPGVETSTTSMANTTESVEHLTVVTCSDLGIDSDRMKQSEAGGFLVSMAMNFLSLLGALLIIYLISRSKRGHRVLVPKKQSDGAIGLPHEWFRDAYRIEYDDMDQISIDGQVVIRLCLLGLKFSAFGSLIACVLVPIYASTSGSQQGVLKFSMTNVTPDSDEYVFWFIVVGAYLLIFNFFWLIRAEWRHFITLRQKHFLRRALGKDGISAAQAQFSLMVERLPTKYQDSRNILSLFSQIFPRQVHSAVAQRDTLLFYHLRALKKTSDTIVVCKCCQGCVHRQLERTVQFERRVAQKYRQAGKYVQDFAMDGQVVELRDDLVSQLGIQQVNQLFSFAHGAGENGQNGSSAVSAAPSGSAWPRPALRRSSRLDAESECAPTSTAFVTLRKLSDRVIAEQIPLFDAGGDSDGVEKVVVNPAPEADAIIWENVQLPLDHILQRRFIGRAICVVGILFWSIPISSIQALASKNVLNELLPHGWLEWIAEHTPVVYSLLILYLPVIALMAVLVLLPMALQLIAVYVEARKSQFEVAISVMHRNFWFQFFSLWLMVFTSSLAQSFLQIMDHPRCISAILGASIPKVSVYFTSFVITRIGISLPLLLLRPESLYSLFFWKPKSASKDTDDSDSDSQSGEETEAGPDETAEAEPNPVYCYFASEVTNINIVFVLALMYCVVAPIMMPACFLYFALAFFVYKWLFVHVYTKQYDLMGETWYACFWGLIVGALFGSISLAGLAAIQKGSKSPPCIALWILSFAILVFAFHCQKTFMPFCAALPYRAAVLADETTSSTVVEGFMSDYYHDPILHELTEKETREILTPMAEEVSEEAESCLAASP